MRSILAIGFLVCAGVLGATTLTGCSGGTEVAELPADEPVRKAEDVVENVTEEEARAAEAANQNMNP